MTALLTLIAFIFGTLFGLYLPKLFKAFIYLDAYTRVIDEGKRTVIQNKN